MKCLSLMIGLALVVIISSRTIGAPVVIAATQPAALPTFQNSGYYGMSPSIDRAFQFSLSADGSFHVEQLQVPLFVEAGIAASQGLRISIHNDAAGQPGGTIAQFHASAIPASPQVVNLMPLSPATLNSGTSYWLLARRTASGQANWNVSDITFGTYAYRLRSDPWVVAQDRNVGAFSLLGSPVPEPTTLVYCCLGGLAWCLRRSRPSQLSV